MLVKKIQNSRFVKLSDLRIIALIEKTTFKQSQQIAIKKKKTRKLDLTVWQICSKSRIFLDPIWGFILKRVPTIWDPQIS